MNRVSVLVALFLALWLQLAKAERDAGSPRIPKSGATTNRFVPPQHHIASKLDADLDGEGLRDAALLVVPDCKDVPEESVQQLEQCEADGRMLVIVFREAKGGYRLSMSKGIPSGVGNHGDHFGGMKLRGRTLSFEGGGSSCAGSTGGDDAFQFRYQARDWFLIGTRQTRWVLSTECSSTSFDRNRDFCPELKLGRSEVCVQVVRSTNFNTSTQESIWSIEPATGNGFQESERTIVQRKRLARKPLVRLADITLDF